MSTSSRPSHFLSAEERTAVIEMLGKKIPKRTYTTGKHLAWLDGLRWAQALVPHILTEEEEQTAVEIVWSIREAEGIRRPLSSM